MKYRTIVVDPPWPYGRAAFKRSAATGFDSHVLPGPFVVRDSPYEFMSLDAIESIPVADLADLAGCRLFLWTTNRFLGAAFKVMTEWGFKYGQTLVWDKRGCSPLISIVAPNSAEFILVGSIGSPERTGQLSSAVLAHGVPKDHSRKPEMFVDLIEQVSPGPYVELFSRRHRLGWDVWGNESANTAQWVAG